ncbi:hypothetical protein MNR01_11450 [Lysobacter sp. S4-A87]|uniref:hypothetical protein n=1 Tax=Lysobacter sp. S4-A87 TaxID=2925843 RepID=UPI001F53CA7A|nr:hypothetical protein [Lysobacter sp. S4-A87]UNK48383.1 hypothetical protein MNR01_11450 [Lysobacter sp. S4-A87]
MLSTLAVVVVFLLMLAWLVRASRRWTSSGNDGGWDAGYQTPLTSDGGSCSPEDEREASCDSDSDPDSDTGSDGGDCSSDGGSD